MTDPAEQKALDDIAAYGCHIIQVLAEGSAPPFSYSIGIGKMQGKPDLCVIGLKEPIAKFVINEYNRRIGAGEAFETGVLYAGFLEGFDVCFEDVSENHHADYFGWAIWYYGGPGFSVRQLVYPTTSGIYPWSDDAPEDFLRWQPILTEDGMTSVVGQA